MKTIVRGKLIHSLDKPGSGKSETDIEYIDDGALLLDDGHIQVKGLYAQLIKEYPGIQVQDHSGCYIIPGMVDAHVHSVQSGAMASYGSELLEWLENHIFPLENRFNDPEFARTQIDFFLKQLLKNGTTTAAVFSSLHTSTTELLFEKASELKLRIISGKTLMDRNAPEYLTEPAQRSYDRSLALIKKWHQRGRIQYAITPRYAITSSPEELELAGSLKNEFPDLYIQTHISENRNEVKEVLRLFKDARHYLEVYARYGLITGKTLLAHCIHLSREEMEFMATHGATAVHCPAANLFLGSGMFDYHEMKNAGIRVAAGTDVGAGDSFSMLRTMNQAYKVSVMKGHPISPAELFHLATLGGAMALSLDQYIGNFEPGKEADLVVLDPSAIDLVKYRLGFCENIDDVIFTLIMLGDERLVKTVYIFGKEIRHV